MNYWTTSIILVVLISCGNKQHEIVGKWKVNSKYLNATYQILEEDRDLKGLVLYYDDGTSKFKFDGKERYYVFKNLKKEGDLYVDGMSGATVKNEEEKYPKSIEIKQKHKDTLEVTTFVMNKPVTEIWTRK